jgi:hypothetical protein
MANFVGKGAGNSLPFVFYATRLEPGARFVKKPYYMQKLTCQWIHFAVAEGFQQKYWYLLTARGICNVQLKITKLKLKKLLEI